MKELRGQATNNKENYETNGNIRRNTRKWKIAKQRTFERMARQRDNYKRQLTRDRNPRKLTIIGELQGWPVRKKDNGQ